LSKSKKLREIVDEVWLKILQHPFVLELYSGTLPISKFKYYAIQDYNYLVSMTKVLSIMSVKAPDLARTKLALELAYKTITVEMANYEELLSSLGLSIDEVVKIEPNPTNIAYMNFLLTTCYTHDYWRIMSALLPCFWTYREIALTHKEKLSKNNVEIYKKWASVYLSDEYAELVKIFITEVDSSPLTIEEMIPFFKLASRYEYIFWDAAYREEKWPV